MPLWSNVTVSFFVALPSGNSSTVVASAVWSPTVTVRCGRVNSDPKLYSDSTSGSDQTGSAAATVEPAI